ncbi:MAG TPA: beta-propeller fold lactonase family protein [Bryobacteraceae bacterium]|nr:beta-propeller fold lactonase family protein [Bryobacteraceae bacterium]
MRGGLPGGILAAWLLLGQSAPDAGIYPSPVDLAVSPDGSRVYVVCEGTGELAVVDAARLAVAARVRVGRVPRGIALSPDGRRIYVTNSWSDNVTEIAADSLTATRTLPAGFEPTGAVVDPSGQTLYVANRISDDISVIDLATGREGKRLVAGRGASYLAVSGSRIYAAHIYPNPGKFRTSPESEITQIDAGRQIVEARLRLHNVAGIFRIACARDGGVCVAPQLRPKNLIPLAHVAHGWAFGDSLAVFGEDVGGVVQLPLDELERYFSRPFGVAMASDKSRLYLTASGSDEVAIVDLRRLMAAARSPEHGALVNDLSVSGRYFLSRIPAGRDPRGIALSPDGAKLYIANRLDDSISVLDTAAGKIVATVGLGGPAVINPQRRGERLFYSSKFSFQGQFACANCHLDSTFDGLAWDLEPDGFGVDIVDNRAIEDVANTAPFKWNGGNPDLYTECGPRTERFFFRSQGFRGADLDDLITYVASVPLRPNRYRAANGELTAAQERGKAIFDRTQRKDGSEIPEQNRCSVCHSGPYHTNRKLADVGSGKATDRSPLVDVPHLTNIALSAPYLHDGSAGSLEEIWTVFNPKDTHGVTNDLAKDELNDLIEYLKTL